jgi:hypothetical protein
MNMKELQYRVMMRSKRTVSKSAITKITSITVRLLADQLSCYPYDTVAWLNRFRNTSACLEEAKDE